MQTISNEELERRFDAGEVIIGYADMSSARRPNLERVRRIRVDVPEAMACGLDRIAIVTTLIRRARSIFRKSKMV